VLIAPMTEVYALHDRACTRAAGIVTMVNERDLQEVLDVAGDDLKHFRRARLYVTGGTGFFGTWLCRTILYANRRMKLGIECDVLTRNPDTFARAAPDIALNSAIRVLRGDVLFPPTLGGYDGVVHAATEASAAMNQAEPARMLAVIVDGMRALIDRVIAPNGAIPVLFTSSGAVYGRQPTDMAFVPETYACAPDPLQPVSAYHEGKRSAELLLAIAGEGGACLPKIARLFAFLGPRLPIDTHFAAGNFVRDAIRGEAIVVRGDGTPLRSYLYPTDMIAWCLALFTRGVPSRAYNVGSSEPVSIADLAGRIAAAVQPSPPVSILGRHDPGAPIERYVPDTTRIEGELGVRRTVSLDEAIARTVAYHQAAKRS
jgi:nucleoside-diphosphate-sugar epimerase